MAKGPDFLKSLGLEAQIRELLNLYPHLTPDEALTFLREANGFDYCLRLDPDKDFPVLNYRPESNE